MTYEELTDEQKQRARSCESAEELIEFARSEGIDLTDEQIEGVTGGAEWYGSTHSDTPGF